MVSDGDGKGELIGGEPEPSPPVAPPPAPHITSLQLHHHPKLPPELEVRPLTGPFGLAEDLKILEDIDKTSSKNMWDLKRSKNAKALIGIFAFMGVTIAMVGGMIYFMIASTGGGPAMTFNEPLLTKVRLGILTVTYGMIFMVLMALNMALPMDKRVKVIPLVDGKRSNEHVTATSTPKGPFNFVFFSTGFMLASGAVIVGEEQMMCAPMARETFFWRYHKTMMKMWFGGGLLLSLAAVLFLDMFLPFDWLVTIKVTVVSFVSGALMIFLAPAFRHLYAVRMAPSSWYWIRNTVPYLLLLVLAGDGLAAGLVLNPYAGAGDMLNAFLANPFVKISLAIPMAFADVSVSTWPAWHSVLIVGAFLGLSYLSYRKLRAIDYPTSCTRLYLSETYVPAIFKDKVKTPSPSPYPKVQPIDHVRPTSVGTAPSAALKPASASIQWASVDRGEGAKAIETMLRVMQGKYHPALAPVILATVLWSLTMVLRYLAGNYFAGSIEMLLMILPTEVYVLVSFMFVIPLGKKGTEVVDVLRLLPLDAGDILKAFGLRKVLYIVGPYVVWATLYFTVFGYSDPMVFAGVYLLIPALLATASYFSAVLHLLQKSAIWGLFALMIIYSVIVTFVYLIDFWILGYMPLWVSLSLSSGAILLPIPLTGWLARTALHRPYLKLPNWRARLRLQAVLVAALLLIVTMLPLATPAVGIYLIPGTQPMIVSHRADGAELIADKDITYKGSLSVPAGADLVIRNSTIRFKVVQSEKTGIWVDKGGFLEIYNSTVTSAGGHYIFKVYGTLSMANSTVRYTWGKNEDGGIHVVRGHASLVNVTVERSLTFGIDLSSSSAYVRNCTIRHNGYYGIRAYADRSDIESNTLENNSIGILTTEGSTTTIAGNRILNNSGSGIYVEYSNPTIRDNLIADNGGHGIMIDNGQPQLGVNTYNNNTLGNIGYPEQTDFGTVMAGVFGAMIAIIVVLVLVMVVFAKRRRNQMLQQQEAQQAAPQPLQMVEEKRL